MPIYVGMTPANWRTGSWQPTWQGDICFRAGCGLWVRHCLDALLHEHTSLHLCCAAGEDGRQQPFPGPHSMEAAVRPEAAHPRGVWRGGGQQQDSKHLPDCHLLKPVSTPVSGAPNVRQSGFNSLQPSFAACTSNKQHRCCCCCCCDRPAGPVAGDKATGAHAAQVCAAAAPTQASAGLDRCCVKRWQAAQECGAFQGSARRREHYACSMLRCLASAA